MRGRVFVAIAFLLAAQHAAAQLPSVCQAPQVSLAPTTFDFTPGAVVPFTVIVMNANRIATTADLSFEVPAGFAVNPQTATLQNIPATNSAEIEVRVTALDTAPVGATGALSATVTLTCGTAPVAQQSDSVTASANLRVVAPPEPPLSGVLAYAEQPAVIAAAGLALVILVGAVALRRTREGFTVTCPEPRKTVRPGRGTSFPLEVANRAGSTDTAVFEIGEVPEGWTAFTAVPELQLGPREGRTIWLMVRAPASAAVGARLDVPVRAESRSRPGRKTELTLVAEVSDAAPEEGA